MYRRSWKFSNGRVWSADRQGEWAALRVEEEGVLEREKG